MNNLKDVYGELLKDAKKPKPRKYNRLSISISDNARDALEEIYKNRKFKGISKSEIIDYLILNYIDEISNIFCKGGYNE